MVLVGLVLILLTGGIAGSSGGVIGVTFGSTGKKKNNNVQYYEYTYRYAPGRDYDISEEDIEDYLEYLSLYHNHGENQDTSHNAKENEEDFTEGTKKERMNEERGKSRKLLKKPCGTSRKT